MGLVGVNGNVTFSNLHKGCLLYISFDGEVTSYNNGYCLFPIVGAAVVAFLTLLFLIYGVVVLLRKDEFAPRTMSILFLIFAASCALLSFAICGEIGIGLNKGCKILGDQAYRCRKTKNFNALWGACIAAGIMGGLWILAMLLELFQLKGRPGRLNRNSDYVNQTAVTPHPVGSKTSFNPRDSGHHQYHDNSAIAATNSAAVQKEEYQQPKSSSHPPKNSQYQNYAQHPQPQQQPYTQTTAAGVSHPTNDRGVTYTNSTF
ncbi:hypothetical protein BG011_001772 [Mortierella polycephala]|uniref:Uncharacterized protein n=1 Tax=Mortierella polycephala TaxID=41804 RepID=A0A9P6QE21_9FUNG|nr:hypothetical protein BG011_001772 [Mortierella polycephala]